MTFVVRVWIDANGLLQGMVTHSQTGRKEQFVGLAQLGDAIAAMAGTRESAQTGLARLDRSVPMTGAFKPTTARGRHG